MNVRKFFAGMTAAALAASMMSMAAMAADVEPDVDAIPDPEFNGQFFVMGVTNWDWKSVDGTVEDGVIKISGDAAELAAQSKHDDDASIGNAGIQLYLTNGSEFEAGTKIEGAFTYSIQHQGTAPEDENDNVDFNNKLFTENFSTLVKDDGTAVVEISLFGYGSNWAKLDSFGNFEITGEVTDFEVTAPASTEVESDYNTVDVVNGGVYAGDWSGDGLKNVALDRIVPEDGMVITVKYSLAPADKSSKQDDNGEFYWDQNAFAPMDQHGWPKLGDEWEFSQDGWEVDPTITKATVNENKDKEAFEAERDAAEGPFMKKDGFILVKEDGELTFKLNEKMIKELQARAEENKGEDGSVWYGLGFQVYGVVLDQVIYEYNTTAVDKFTVNGDVSFNQSVKIDPAEYGVKADSEFSKIKIGLKGITVADKGIEDGDTEHSYWNDWCTYKIKITKADGTVAYAAVIGDQVSWPTTVDEGDPDNDEDNIVIDVADCVKAEAGTGKAVVELDYEFGDTYEVIALGWDGFPDDPYINVVGVAFDDAEIDWPAEPAPVDESVPDESTPDESTPESTTESTPESKTESKPGNSGNNGGSNANTGAVALGLGVLTLAGAAVVVTKKKF
ncbi:MAG: hypothetical protein IJR91_05690 [Ruminococcus sp.]|nr:hypothetical protein [Ruminococcus sp.]